MEIKTKFENWYAGIYPLTCKDENLYKAIEQMFNNKQAEITRLTAEVAKLRKDKWISVDDILPDEIKSVLAAGVLRGDKKISVNECYFSQGKWWSVRNTTIHKVTYWQPLPISPAIDAAIKSKQKESE
jgi:hypothetical protein